MDKQMTAIEFTTHNIRLLTGYCNDNQPFVMQCLEGENLKIGENGLPDKEQLKTSLVTLINKAKSQLKLDSGPLIFLYPTIGFVTIPVSENTPTANEENRLAKSEYKSCYFRAMKRVDSDKQNVYLAPYSFKVDSQVALDYFPLGTVTRSVEVDGDIHQIDQSVYRHYHEVMDKLDLKSYIEMVSPYAATQFIFLSYQHPSYLLINLEHEYASISFIRNRRMVSSTLLKNDYLSLLGSFASALKVSKERAEELITTFGFLPKLEFDYQTDEGFTLEMLSKSLFQAAVPMLMEVRDFTDRYSVSGEIPILLTGAESEIFGLDACFKNALHRETSIFRNKVLGVPNSSFLPVLGAIRAGFYDYQPGTEAYRKKQMDSELKAAKFDR